MKPDESLFCSFSLDLLDVITLINAGSLFEEANRSFQTKLWPLNLEVPQVVDDVMRLDKLYKEDSTDLARMIEVTLMVPLLLQNV